MDEKRKSIWKKSWKGPRATLFLAVFVAVLGSLVAVCSFLPPGNDPPTQLGWAGLFLGVFGGVLLLYLIVHNFRKIFCWRTTKRCFFILACLVTLIALFYAEENWRGKHAWEKFKREQEAKGEHFDFASIVPPPVPDDQNFAMAPIFDATDKLASHEWRKKHAKKIPNIDKKPWDTNLLDPLEISIGKYGYSPTNGTGNREKNRMSDLRGWQQFYRTLALTTNEFPIAPQPQSPAADVLLALSKYDSVIEELRQAGHRPYSRFPLDYDDENPSEILLPHLATLKRCALVLQLRAIAELQAGQTEKALNDVNLALRLADAVRTEPFLISHLVRIAILNITIQPIWEGLAEHKWSDEQLVALDRELAKLDFLSDCGVTMRGERVASVKSIDYIRHARRNIQLLWSFNDGEHTGKEYLTAALYRFGPAGWLYQNQLRICRFYARWYLPEVDDARKISSPTVVSNASAAFESEIGSSGPYNLLEAMLLTAFDNVTRNFANAQMNVGLARVACALERFRLAHGKYPESLDALAPQFIEKIPHDIINGEPLKYRPTDDGQFVLYSVGWNEKDDGGAYRQVHSTQTSKRNRSYWGEGSETEEGDWVWRYPVKPEVR